MFGFNKQKRLNKSLYAAAHEGNIREIARLLDEGADIEWRASSYWNATPLGVAAHKGHHRAVRLLLDRGANMGAVFDAGDTPLIYALYSGNVPTIKELLDRGADRTVENDKGLNAVEIAKGRGEDVRQAMGLRVVEVQKPAPPPEIDSDPDEIVLKRRIGDKVLEEVFNFAARERISLLRARADGPVEVMTRESFDEVNESVVRRAFDVYAKQGGRIPEAEVFPASMAKIKPGPRAG